MRMAAGFHFGCSVDCPRPIRNVLERECPGWSLTRHRAYHFVPQPGCLCLGDLSRGKEGYGMSAGPIWVGRGKKVDLLDVSQDHEGYRNRRGLPEASGLASKGCIMSRTALSPWRSSLFSDRMRSLC